jgi:hypothetical protein
MPELQPQGPKKVHQYPDAVGPRQGRTALGEAEIRAKQIKHLRWGEGCRNF